MKDWKHCSDKEIDDMTFNEAKEIIERQISLGYKDGDFRPRKHMTKALELILEKAIMYEYRKL